ncbi:MULTISPECIES: sugar porter family MFS transporter [unclassified Streptomyces]|uniref:sugar porter family MFS transporter n=1 Tax=unclassified Streptomyces TaxID=2593676 RepID=UPI002E290F92|nr:MULTISPECIES: sugar porter family MFS transporter [unclassified Streptomyces]WUB90548.1 sugar porter family MFS transporter [Streptomyces sp. NBC_00566]
MMQGFSREPGTHGPVPQVPPEGLRKVYRWAAMIAVGGFLFGYDTGVVSGALLFITDDFRLSAAEQGTIVSVLLIGAMAGALLAGRLADALGRRRAVALEGAVFIVGTAIAATAPAYWQLLVGRVVLGLAVGAASATVPVYLSEISPTSIRGRVLSANQLMITVGILVSYLVDLAFSGSGDWRLMFALGAVPAAVLTLCMLLVVPESLPWLVRKGRWDQAREVLTQVLPKDEAERVVTGLRHRDGSHAPRPGWRTLLGPKVRPALIVAVTMAVIQQFGGINTIIYYAPTIIEKTGLSASNSIFYSVFIGVINLVMTILATRLIDRAGRRTLLLVSLAGMALLVALLGLSFIAGWNSELSLLCMVLYIAAYAGGLGPIFWVLVGEVFPPSVRALGSSTATTTNWISNFAVSQAFLPVAAAIGQGETFLVFAAICFCGLLFVARFVPETKGRSFEEVDAALQARFGHPGPAGDDSGRRSGDRSRI